MKSTKIFISFAIALAIFISCNESDIDLHNPSQIVVDTYFKSEAQLNSTSAATYAYLQSTGNYARYQFFLNDGLGGELFANSNLEGDKLAMVNLAVTAENNGGNNEFWQHNYQGIGRCNFLIANEESIENVDAAIVNSRIGEALFLRAFYHFMIVTHYNNGNVPLIQSLETQTGGEPDSPRSVVYAGIIDDLNLAISKLPSNTSQDEGRISREAAYTLLGKVLLQRGDTGDATAALTALSNVSGYTLEANYFDNFLITNEYNSESIFEVDFDETTANGNPWGFTERGTANETTFRSQEYSGWFNANVSDDLLNVYDDGDTRFSDNFFSPSGNGYNTLFNDVDFNGDPITEFGHGNNRPAWRKYQNGIGGTSNPESGINFRVLRYADVLLMRAEAELKSTGDIATAFGYLDELRLRASQPVLTAGTLTVDQALMEVLDERWRELAGEQSRFYDLQRNANLFTDDPANETDYYDRAVYSIPIPSVERQSNTNINYLF